MTISESGLNRTWARLELFALSGEIEGCRTDISTLLKCRDKFETFSPVYLFWEMYRPSVLEEDGDRFPALKLPAEAKNLVLEILDDMYRHHRVPYEPDNDDTEIREYLRSTASITFEEAELPFPRKLTDLLIFIHVAAARAFVMKEDSGLSEEVVDCLDEVERAWQRLHRAGFPGSVSPDVHTTEFYEIFHSIDAVSAIALAERSRATRDQGHYAEALHMLATADERYSSGALLVMGPSSSELWPLGREKAILHHPPVFNQFVEFLTGMHVPIEYVLETFNMLRASMPDVDWTQVTRDCRRLADATYLCFPVDPGLIGVDDKYGNDYEELWDLSEEYLFDEASSWPGGFPAGEYWEISQDQTERYTIVDEESNRVSWHTFWRDAGGCVPRQPFLPVVRQSFLPV